MSIPIQFAGRSWAAKDSDGKRVPPRNNYFSGRSVEMTSDGLRLRVERVDERLECAEVILVDELEYGTYRFTVATDLNRLASTLTLGMFLYSDDEAFANREIDIEAGRWGKPAADDDMQFVVHPDTTPGHMLRFALGPHRGWTTHEFVWQPDRIDFRTTNGGVVVKAFSVAQRVPPGGAARVRINLWSTTGESPTDGITTVLITDFHHDAL